MNATWTQSVNVPNCMSNVFLQVFTLQLCLPFWPPLPPPVSNGNLHLPVNELILKQKQMSEEKRLKLDHPVSTSPSSCELSVLLLLWTAPQWPVSSLQNGSRWKVFQDALSPDQENLDLANVNLMLELLVQKKKQLEAVRKAGCSFWAFIHPFLIYLHLCPVLIWIWPEPIQLIIIVRPVGFVTLLLKSW